MAVNGFQRHLHVFPLAGRRTRLPRGLRVSTTNPYTGPSIPTVIEIRPAFNTVLPYRCANLPHHLVGGVSWPPAGAEETVDGYTVIGCAVLTSRRPG